MRHGVDERPEWPDRSSSRCASTAAARPDRVERGLLRPVAVGVRVEHRLDPWQVHPDHSSVSATRSPPPPCGRSWGPLAKTPLGSVAGTRSLSLGRHSSVPTRPDLTAHLDWTGPTGRRGPGRPAGFTDSTHHDLSCPRGSRRGIQPSAGYRSDVVDPLAARQLGLPLLRGKNLPRGAPIGHRARDEAYSTCTLMAVDDLVAQFL